MSKSDYDYSFELGRKMERTPGSFNQGMSPSGFANGPAGGSPKQGSPHSHSSHSSSPSNSSYSSVGESGSNSNLSRLRVEMPSQRLEVLQDPPSYSSV
ncbi:hypothetical protein EON64_08195 [archaeon]|nr:MAG: hypothetical protein EON64_08195 [archaeon]